MAGFGRFKLTDALPAQPVESEESQFAGGAPGSSPTGRGKGRSKKKGKSAADASKEAQAASPDADPSIRDRMVDIGRANQQTGRQRTTGK